MKTTILVIGATGMIGQAVSKQMKMDGFTLRIMTRNKEKAQKIFGDDYDIREGDVFNKDTLGPSFEGVQGVYITLPEHNIQVAVKNILEQSGKASVNQIGYTSGCTVREENAWHPMIRSHFDAEKLIMKSGIAYSIFRPTMVLDMLPRYANNGKPFIIGKQPQRWSWIYTGDMAKMISKAFQTKEARDQKFTIFGPDKLSIPEAVNLFNAEFYPTAKEAKPTPYWISKLIALFVGSQLKKAISIFKYFEDHPEEGDPSEANNLLGKPETGLKEYFNIYGETIK